MLFRSEQAEAVLYFQMNGCLAINKRILQNNCRDWNQIRQTIDQFIKLHPDFSSYKGNSPTGRSAYTGYYLRKFMNANYNQWDETIMDNTPWIFFRLAEFYLNYAECQIELGLSLIHI